MDACAYCQLVDAVQDVALLVGFEGHDTSRHLRDRLKVATAKAQELACELQAYAHESDGLVGNKRRG